MKKLIALLLALALLLSMAACTSPAADPVPEEKETESTEVTAEKPTDLEPEPPAATSTPLLYKVTGENGGTVWLFGSIHVGIEEMYPFPAYVLDAYNEADALAVECDVIALQKDMALMTELVQMMLYTDGTTISDNISPELYEAAVKILEENNSYMKALDYYLPVMWYSTIENFTYANAGYDSDIGIDMTLLTMAKAEDKPILEVESAKFQYEMLASFSPELQELLLQESVDGYTSTENHEALDALLTAWCQGDLDALLEYLNEEPDSDTDPEELKLIEEFSTAMIVDRNIAMADYAEEILNSNDRVFICVGMAHILGDGAMVDLLQQRGYTVERVTNSDVNTLIMSTNASKDSVDAFLSLLGDIEPDGLLSGCQFDEEHCFNVTPEQVAAETDMQIFKFSDSCASYVMLDNEIYLLCDFFGGYGFVNAVPCDFDNDGNKDLLVASSWGSGMHRSIISVFNSVTKESTVLYDTSDTDKPNTGLFVSTVVPVYSSTQEFEDLPVTYMVYSARIITYDSDFINLSYVSTGVVGSIEVENGTPVFQVQQ